MSHPQSANPLRVPDFEVVPGSPFQNDQMGHHQVVMDWTDRYIHDAVGPCCLAINGNYGTGKSAILGMWAEYLRDDSERYKVAEINLWKTCFLDNPLLACLLELNKESIIQLEKGDWWHKLIDLAKRGIPIITDTIVPGGSAISAIIDNGPPDSRGILPDVQAFNSYAQTLQRFNEEIAKHMGQKRLVIFADELDRCDATYAVRCLEVIKLLFTFPQVTFIVGVNLTQLDAAIRQRYGWDAQAYRRRFFDLTLDVPPPISYILKSYCDKHLTDLDVNNHAMGAWRLIQDALIGDPDQPGNQTADSVHGTMLTLRELRQFLIRWSIVCKRLVPDASPDAATPESCWALVLELATSLLIAKHLAPQLYRQMLEGSCSDADVFEAVDSALGSRAAIFTSPLVARLKSILSICMVVSDHTSINHHMRLLIARGRITDVRNSKIWINEIDETPQADVSAYEQLADGPFKKALGEMVDLSFMHINCIVSEVEGYGSGALE